MLRADTHAITHVRTYASTHTFADARSRCNKARLRSTVHDAHGSSAIHALGTDCCDIIFVSPGDSSVDSDFLCNELFVRCTRENTRTARRQLTTGLSRAV